jgi:hypothetical protein
VKLGVDTLQSGKIEAGGQGLRNKLAHEFLHHARMGKEPVIQRVRVRHRWVVKRMGAGMERYLNASCIRKQPPL